MREFSEITCCAVVLRGRESVFAGAGVGTERSGAFEIVRDERFDTSITSPDTPSPFQNRSSTSCTNARPFETTLPLATVVATPAQNATPIKNARRSRSRARLETQECCSGEDRSSSICFLLYHTAIFDRIVRQKFSVYVSKTSLMGDPRAKVDEYPTDGEAIHK